MSGFGSREFFDEAAATWDDHVDRTDRTHGIAQAIAKAVELHPAMTVFEYGAGTGALAEQLAPRVARIVAADASSGMVAQMKARSAPIEPLQLDLVTDEAPTERFDLVIASMVMHHVEDVDAMLATLASLLLPGGHLAIADLEPDPDHAYHGEEMEVHHGFDPTEFAMRMAAIGLINTRSEHIHSYAKDADDPHHTFGIFLATGQVPAPE